MIGKRTAAMATIAAVATVLTACSSSTSKPSGSSAAPKSTITPSAASSAPAKESTGHAGDLAKALASAPPGTNEVYFTDWVGLGHPHDPFSLGANFFAGPLTSQSLAVHQQLGVYPTDADWELQALPSRTAVLHFARPADLDALGRGLAKAGWTRSGAGGAYQCRPAASCASAQLSPESWGYRSEFAIDRTAGLLIRFPSGRPPKLPDPTLSHSSEVRAVLSSDAHPLSAMLRVGRAACGDVLGWFRDPSSALQRHDQLAKLQDGLGTVRATLLAIDSSTALRGSAAVVLSSPAGARAEAVRRAALPAQLADVADQEPNGLTFRVENTSSSVVRYSVTAASGRSMTEAADQNLGVDVCPRPLPG